jgi:hypothetical protein
VADQVVRWHYGGVVRWHYGGVVVGTTAASCVGTAVEAAAVVEHADGQEGRQVEFA